MAHRFAERRMDVLYDEPRPGARREIGDDEIASMIRKTLETPPKGGTHRSLRSMAKEIAHAPSTVHRIWRAIGLHRTASRLSSSLQIRRSSRKFAISSGFTCRHPNALLCCVSMRKARYRRSIARNPCCRCDRGRSSGLVSLNLRRCELNSRFSPRTPPCAHDRFEESQRP